MLSDAELSNLVRMRRVLHQNPELSGYEKQTALYITSFLGQLKNCIIETQIGGHGVLASFRSTNPGLSVLVRVDTDALPIKELSSFAHASQRENTAHLCGHDGHTTIGLGLAQLLDRTGLDSGNVSILFQPAEETGEGARRVLNDPVFSSKKFDSAVALHNLPGFPLNEVIVKDGTFACASQGLRLEFEGATSHAAEPENGRNPLDSMVHFLEYLRPMREISDAGPFRLLTVVHVGLGEEAYGISPGSGRIALTLRAETDELLSEMKHDILSMASQLARENNLEFTGTDQEIFAATVNEPGFAEQIKECCQILGLPCRRPDQPFRWSEDAGLLLKKYGGGYFGIGAGIDKPALHNPYFDFSDELIAPGVRLFHQYILSQQKKHAENLTY